MINHKFLMKELLELLIIKDHLLKMVVEELKYIKMVGEQFVILDLMPNLLKWFVNKWDMMMDL